MKAIPIILLILGLMLSANELATAKGSPIKGAKIILKSPSGKTYTATTDNSGKFEFSNVEPEDGGFTISIQSDNKTYLSSSKATYDIKSNKTAREHASGMASGKRTHKPIRFRGEFVSEGNTNEHFIITCESDGSLIQGMAINEKGLPGKKSPATNTNK